MRKAAVIAIVGAVALGVVAERAVPKAPPCVTRSKDGKNAPVDLGRRDLADCVAAIKAYREPVRTVPQSAERVPLEFKP